MSGDAKPADNPAESAGAPTPTGFEIWEWMRNVHLEPEIARRRAAGDLEEGTEVWAAQILFRHDREPEVRLNKEVQGLLEVEAMGPIEKGQEVTRVDMGSVSGFLLPEADGDAAHITMLATSKGLSIVFDGAYNAVRIESQLKSADEFLAVAVDSLAKGRLRAFAENAFGACELLAGAEILWLPDRRVLARKHGAIRSLLHQWARLGNTDPRFPKLLDRLDELRTSSRYLRGEFSLNCDEAQEILDLLRQMRDHAWEVRPQRALGTHKPRAYTVIATRDVRAGEMLLDGDTRIFN